jgi:3D (Asp-Asp-Asp) domain-containing protein
MHQAAFPSARVRLFGSALALGTAFFVTGCTSPTLDLSSAFQGFRRPSEDSEPQSQFVVKTTAYCHQEADSQPYGHLTARGTKLRSTGPVRSAAADWSKYPVGTQFRIIGHPQIYEIDDYGSALVGTETIDIYQPTMRSMRNWGAPVVGIEVVRWGSYAESEAILAQRAHRAPHVRTMLEGVREKQAEEASRALTPVSGRFFRRDA